MTSDEEQIESKHLTRVLSVEEYSSIQDIMSLKEKVWYGIQFYCGLRQKECVQLKRDEVNLHTGVSYIIGSKPKQTRQRIIIIPSFFIPVINEYIKIHDPQHFLFEKSPGQQYKYVGHLRENLKKYCKQKGLYNADMITHYSLRHSFATNLIENGAPIEIVSSLLGHVEIETTMKFYIHLGYKIKHYWVNTIFSKVADNPIYYKSDVLINT